MSDPVFVDLYAGDLNGHPNIDALVKAGDPWHGVVLKATEGVYYPSGVTAKDWFLAHWLPARILAGDRYGVDWFRGAYHYLRIDEDPKRQADLYLSLIQQAGGWGPGDLWPIVDVESAGNPVHASAQQVIDVTSKWAAEIHAVTGKSPILYGGSYIRDRQIKDPMGCQMVWVADYSSTLPSHIYTDMGWPLQKLFAWQYQGTEGFSGPKNYPRLTPFSSLPLDLSAMTMPGGLKALRDALSGGTQSQT
jgi:GH25 family lysozyme M1 (1,4-beta-N-acetylmuramidase)